MRRTRACRLRHRPGIHCDVKRVRWGGTRLLMPLEGTRTISGVVSDIRFELDIESDPQ